MSVHKKLQEARVKLQKTPLHKSGKNTFSGYSYFELGDFLPTVQEIFLELGLCGTVSFGNDLAMLTIHNIDGEGSITFTSPMSTAALKGCHEVQNLGAVQSYIRRYLWTTALEIVENDVLDAVTGKETPAKKSETVKTEAKPLSFAQPVAKAEPVKQEPVKEATAPVAEPAPTGSFGPVAAPEKKETMTGEAGEPFRMRVTYAPEGDPFDWLNLVSDAAHLALTLTKSEADVMAIFKTNKVIFDKVKEVDQGAFDLIMAQFTEVKNKFKGA